MTPVYDTWWWDSIQICLSTLFFLDVIVEGRRRRAVKGSYERYRLATIQCVTIWAGAVVFPLQAVEYVARDWWGWVGLNAILLVLHAWRIRAFFRDDDDNWFKRNRRRLRRRLRRWVRNRARVNAPAPAGAAA